MFPYDRSVDPVFQSCLDSGFAFMNQLSRTLSTSFQGVCDANVKLGQTMLEQTFSTGQRMLTSTSADDVLGAVAAGAYPASEKLRAYQQHLSALAADTQVDLAHVAQQDGPEASPAADASADDAGAQSAGDDPGSGMRSERRMQSERRANKTMDGGRPAA